MLDQACTNFPRRQHAGDIGTDIVLVTELLAERRAHDGAANTGWGAEVRLARLPARTGEAWHYGQQIVTTQTASRRHLLTGVDLRHIGDFDGATRL